MSTNGKTARSKFYPKKNIIVYVWTRMWTKVLPSKKGIRAFWNQN